MARRDPAAFTEFVTARSRALHRSAYLMVGDAQLAQDLVQEALTKTYVAWPRLRDPAKAEAYARRTITNTAISWFRKRSWRAEQVTDALPERPAPGADGTVDQHDWVWSAILDLPARQRASLVLRYYEDLSEAQTAEVLDCAVGTVKSQVSAALARLRQTLGDDLADSLLAPPTQSPSSDEERVIP